MRTTETPFPELLKSWGHPIVGGTTRATRCPEQSPAAVAGLERGCRSHRRAAAAVR
ncbi:hypothetical protein STRTUCAR8_06605 [Streptomyces turgidiscabies Car8]|uniref:Uncharacterized protein n=1 Tax=Streptomyces turgidiscabies (strain Car8) TaxID=698760 RepID=L7EYN6_STRT8|nr:hypothetical protein STRTUCAR8_06605 [Streptomyces turgidiscabies Car8]